MDKIPKGPYRDHRRPKAADMKEIVFSANTLSELGQRKALLSCDTLNPCCELLHDLYHDRPVTIFPMYLSVSVSRDQVWRLAKHCIFWDTEVWIFLIHLPDAMHWTLATAYLGMYELNIFDSLKNSAFEEETSAVSHNCRWYNFMRLTRGDR